MLITHKYCLIMLIPFLSLIRVLVVLNETLRNKDQNTINYYYDRINITLLVY
jgi:hypothetical protein